MAGFNRNAMLEQHQKSQGPSSALAGEGTTSVKSDTDNLLLELRSFRFLNQETGFFVAQGKTTAVPKDIPALWRGRFNPAQVTIKGSALSLASHDAIGSTIECHGEWVLDPKFGLQFQFEWAREAMPSTVEALERYLSLGRIKQIGPSTAKLMVEKWGMDTLEILSTSPEKLLSIPGITEKKLKEIKKSWDSKKDNYQLTSFFGLHGVGEIWIDRIIEKLGDQSLEARIRNNPYLLTEVDGIGFATADKMAMSLGFSPRSVLRVEAMLTHLLKEYTERQGHTARPIDDWLREAADILQIPQKELQPTAQELVNRKSVVVRNLPYDGGFGGDPKSMPMVPCVSLRREFNAERSIASDFSRLLSSTRDMTSTEETIVYQRLGEKSKTLDPSQLEGALGVLSSPFSILTGGPGTGKTTTLKSVIDIAEEMGWNVVLAAPTGRAAKRMEEAIGRKSATIHRCLAYDPKSSGFKHNRTNPLVGDIFVIDEASMIDNSIGASFLSAIPSGARVLFVGDIDQLPSVGAGNFLRDLIASGKCPVHRLNRVHRQAEGSLIAEAASRIISGRMPDLQGDELRDDFAWISPPTGLTNSEINEFIFENIKSTVARLLSEGVAREDIQVISPQRDGIVGVQGLNDGLRWLLNENGKPSDEEESSKNIVLGDRLLVTRNNYEKEIFNGDMGTAMDLDNETGALKLRMEDGRIVNLERSDHKYLTLGYAITVHKSQGGERPVVIMPCSPSHGFSMNKNLIYTGITRGKNKVLVVGSPKTLHNALRKEEKTYRLTGLVDEIDKYVSKGVAPSSGSKSFCPR